MPKTSWTLVAGLLLLGCIAGYSADSTPRFTVDIWTGKNGLPQNEVFAITQTRDGYLWLGTASGLARFDGTDFRLFEDKDIPGLNGSKIVKLFEDSARNLWLGTEAAGVLRISADGKVTKALPAKGSAEGPLVAICEDAAGGIWLSLAKGQLYRYGDGRARQLASNCRGLAADDSGVIWVGAPDGRLLGLGPISKSAATAIPVSYDPPVPRLDFLLASKRGGYWRLANGRIQKCHAEVVDKDLGPYPWNAGAAVLAACEDRDGNLVVGTYGDGVYWFEAATPTRIAGLSHSYIFSLEVDREGDLWVGTDGSGLNRVKRNAFELLGGTSGLTVQSVCDDRDGGLWIGYNGEHVDHWTPVSLRQFSSLFDSGGVLNLKVRSVFTDQERVLWVGALEEHAIRAPRLFRFLNDRFQPVTEMNSDVAAIYQDHNGLVWVGGAGGLSRWDQHQWKLFTTRDGLSADNVRAIAEDADGNLWVGTDGGGLNRLTDGKFLAFRRQDTEGLPSDSVASLYADPDGVLWVGTSSGLARFHRGKWARYTTQDGLHSNQIGYIIEDGQGYLWLGSSSGLMRVARRDLNEFARGATKWVPCRTYGEADGLPTVECTTGSQPGACRTSAGKLWFPTIRGLAGVDPKLLHPNTNPPPVVIEAVRIDNQLQNLETLRAPPPTAVTIPPGKEALEIDFASLNLSAPDKGRVRFQLIGHQTAPTERPARERSVLYSKLPPGDYRFEVSACNEDGVWNPAGASLAVKVAPAFWQTRWFLVSVSGGLLGLLIGSVYYVATQRLQRQLAALRQKEALERERARIARDLHDQLGANLTQVALLSEMAEADKELPAEVESHARQISQTALETTHALDEIVWTVNPSNDTLDGLINYICKYAQDYLAMAGLRYRLEAPPSLPSTRISPEFRHNVFLVAKEAINNVVKHAKAAAAVIRLTIEPASLTLEIEDNGRGLGGLDPNAPSTRNGLRNMRKRMEDVGGTFSIGPAPEGGTLVRLTAPLGNN